MEEWELWRKGVELYSGEGGGRRGSYFTMQIHLVDVNKARVMCSRPYSNDYGPVASSTNSKVNAILDFFFHHQPVGYSPD